MCQKREWFSARGSNALVRAPQLSRLLELLSRGCAPSLWTAACVYAFFPSRGVYIEKWNDAPLGLYICASHQVLFIRLEKLERVPGVSKCGSSMECTHQPHLRVISQTVGFVLSMSFSRFGNSIRALCATECYATHANRLRVINSLVCEFEINPVGSMPSNITIVLFYVLFLVLRYIAIKMYTSDM